MTSNLPVPEVPVLTSERLQIRPFTFDDASFIIELLNDKDFIKHIQDRGVRSLEDARAYLTDGPMASYQRFGFGLCCVVEQSSQASVGMCGILKRETLPVPDIGYAFLPGARGKGYAYEAGAEVVRHARSTLKLERILAVTSKSNIASQKLLEKLGFQFMELAQFEPESEAIPCYELKLGEGKLA